METTTGKLDWSFFVDKIPNCQLMNLIPLDMVGLASHRGLYFQQLQELGPAPRQGQPFNILIIVNS